MKPIIKYQGGKSRELSLIKSLLPHNIERVIEPFCGGAAVSYGLEKPAILNDINHQVINLYRVVSDKELYPKLKSKIDEYKSFTHDDLSTIYYEARNVINSPNEQNDALTKAISYIVIRQLCFSGMERYNAKGEFNVPFGHYQKMTCNMSDEHHEFLSKCDIRQGSFSELFDNLSENDFVFLDPPYLDRLGYIDGDGGITLHEELLECCKNTNAKWMIVHSDHEFYRTMYKDYNIHDNDFGYSQRFGKNKTHSNAKVKHLYITNYKLPTLFD
jgi:DNA adenine methylase